MEDKGTQTTIINFLETIIIVIVIFYHWCYIIYCVMNKKYCLMFQNKHCFNCFYSEFDDVMKALKWPFTSLSTAPPLSTSCDDYSKLENVFILLLKLQALYPE